MPEKKMKMKKTQTKVAPPTQENEFTFVMNADEMYSMIQVLSFSKDVFEQMALSALKEGNNKATEVYSARSQLSLMLYNKFKVVAKIGEPDSKDYH